MSTKSLLRTGAVVCALLLTSHFPALAQSENARLQGIITDASGAVVPDAAVKVASSATNSVLQTNTSSAGEYSFPALPPGDYVLTVAKSGFKTTRQTVTLQVAQVANVNLQLETGDVSQSVNVEATAALLDSASSDMGLTVQTRQIEDLPLNGRNFTQLATLIPGVTRGAPGNIATGQGNNAETFRYGTSGGASLVVNGGNSTRSGPCRAACHSAFRRRALPVAARMSSAT